MMMTDMPPLLVVGSGARMWDELAALSKAGWTGDFMAINHVGTHYMGDITHWVSWHLEMLIPARKLRWHHAPDNKNFRCWSGDGLIPEKEEVCDGRFKIPNEGGTSALLAVLIGEELGYTDILMAGCPLDGSGYFYRPGIEHRYDEPVKKAWRWAVPNFKAKVRSMSGFTRDLLGPPE